MADAPNPYGGTWGDDGWIYFTRHSQEGVHKSGRTPLAA